MSYLKLKGRLTAIIGRTIKVMQESVINRSVPRLNQNYEPLPVCSARRAFLLMFHGKAEMIEPANGLRLRTPTTSYSLPSIVRLWQYKRVPYKKIMLSRKNIIMRDKHTCQYCGSMRGSMTVDHVIPKTRKGRDTWENMICACVRCNNRKGDRTPHEAGMRLLKHPRRPTSITFIQRQVANPDHRWRQYLFMD